METNVWIAKLMVSMTSGVSLWHWLYYENILQKQQQMPKIYNNIKDIKVDFLWV